VLLDRIRWSAVFFGFLTTCLCSFLAVPLFEHIGWQVNAGPVDMLTMLSILTGGFVAGKTAKRDEGIQGGLVAVCYILVIWLGKQVLDEIHIANLSGLSALGKVDSWSNFGKDFFYFVAGALGAMWATPFNERERQRQNVVLRSTATTRRRPQVKMRDVTPPENHSAD